MAEENPLREPFIRDLTFTTIQVVAPEELPLYDELISDFFDHSGKWAQPTQPSGGSSALLGIGMEEMVLALTPVVASMASAILTAITSDVFETTKEEGGKILWKKLKDRYLRKNTNNQKPGINSPNTPTPKIVQTASPEPTFSPEQLTKIKKIACLQAQRFGISDQQASLLADVLVGKLILDGSEE